MDVRTKMKAEEESEDIIFPPSHSLTQTDREYFNIVRTEDGQSQFAREQDRGDDKEALRQIISSEN